MVAEESVYILTYKNAICIQEDLKIIVKKGYKFPNAKFRSKGNHILKQAISTDLFSNLFNWKC